MLPDMGQKHNTVEIGAERQIVLGFAAEELDQVIQRAGVGRKQHVYQTAAYRPGDEVRQIADGLNGFFEAERAYFIQQQGKNNGQRKSKTDALHAHDNGVGYRLLKRWQRKQILKILEANPFAGCDSLEDLEILKRDHHAAHGHIAENDIPNQYRKEQQIDLKMTPIELKAPFEFHSTLRILHTITSYQHPANLLFYFSTFIPHETPVEFSLFLSLFFFNLFIESEWKIRYNN